VVFGAAILLSAFLLFQVQPLISRYILPWFGGSPAVWTTAMLFFQLVLFVGYSYAHLSAKVLGERNQSLLHLALLMFALFCLPIVPNSAWKPVSDGDPTLHILGLLAATVGVPYFVLSTTGPLLQAWFAKTCPGVSPYRLYSLSNLGSLAALLSYPFFLSLCGNCQLRRSDGRGPLASSRLCARRVLLAWCALSSKTSTPTCLPPLDSSKVWRTTRRRRTSQRRTRRRHGWREPCG
jgi:hypothetical protein